MLYVSGMVWWLYIQSNFKQIIFSSLWIYAVGAYKTKGYLMVVFSIEKERKLLKIYISC